jgi:hypothetical protein
MSYREQQRAIALQMYGQHSQMVENPHAYKFRHSSTTGSVTGDEMDVEALGGGITIPVEAVVDVTDALRNDADGTGSECDGMWAHKKWRSSFHNRQQQQRQPESARPPPRSPLSQQGADKAKRRNSAII